MSAFWRERFTQNKNKTGNFKSSAKRFFSEKNEKWAIAYHWKALLKANSDQIANQGTEGLLAMKSCAEIKCVKQK